MTANVKFAVLWKKMERYLSMYVFLLEFLGDHMNIKLKDYNLRKKGIDS